MIEQLALLASTASSMAWMPMSAILLLIRNHRADGFKRIALKPVVDEDESFACQPGSFSLGD